MLRIVQRALPLLLILLVGLSTAAFALEKGRGLYWKTTAEMLAESGYPNDQQDFFRPGWGVLYDEEGISYGPLSFYDQTQRLEHPHFTVNDEYLESRWIRVYQNPKCTEALVGHFLEMCDVHYHDLRDQLNYRPEVLLEIYSPATLEDYRRISGRDYWVTHRVRGNAILVEPIDIMFRRTVAGNASRAAVAEAFLDLKCGGRLPEWFREGLSSYLGEQGGTHLSFMTEFRDKRDVVIAPAEVIRTVFPLLERDSGRIARYNAFLMVWNLSENYGFDKVQRLLDEVEKGSQFSDAVSSVYGMSYPEFLDLLDSRKSGEPTLKYQMPQGQ